MENKESSSLAELCKVRVRRAMAQTYSERLLAVLSSEEREIVEELEKEGYLIRDNNAIGRAGKFNPEK